jgi:catechol 2,3-dioxygenase-like lactoylglutathione lyase family enzyme
MRGNRPGGREVETRYHVSWPDPHRTSHSVEAALAFYGRLLGMPVLAQFDDHDGYSGVVFGLPDASRQLEVVSRDGFVPSPTPEDQLVFYLESAAAVAAEAARIQAARLESSISPNPYWEKNGAVCSVDPDGYWLVRFPEAWCRSRFSATPLSVIQLTGAMETDHELIGKIGHVTATIAPGKMGEVMVPVRGGSESFYAYGSDAEEEIPQGCRVLVVDRQMSRTVIVSRY